MSKNYFNLLISISLVGITGIAGAQPFTPFTTSENIDIANIKAAHLVHGDMWNDPTSNTSRCEYPKGSGKHVGFQASLWMGGTDVQQALRMSASTSRQRGIDYWPGPIDVVNQTLALIYQRSQGWAKIWKINRTEIDLFKTHTVHTSSNIPQSILEWPARGNAYARGNGGVPLTISVDMAPFVDLNNDGNYNPYAGDYPQMKGDQMLWWIYTDKGVTHNATGVFPISVEISQIAYAYKRGTIADNIIFYEYLVANKGSLRINNFRLAVYADFDLGYALDDYIGFDSSHRMGFTYNATDYDGNGAPGHYGNNPPIAGITVIELPGDQPANNSFLPAGSFMNGGGNYGLEYYRLMTSTSVNGTPLPNGAKYIFDENDECNLFNESGDRRLVIASGDMILEANETKKLGMALVVAGGGGCPNMNFNDLHEVADTAWKLYYHPSQPSTNPTAIGTIAAGSSALGIYPNPAAGTLNIQTQDGAQGRISIVDALGRSISLTEVRNGAQITLNTLPLPAGVYTIRYQHSEGIQTGIFVKQ